VLAIPGVEERVTYRVSLSVYRIPVTLLVITRIWSLIRPLVVAAAFAAAETGSICARAKNFKEGSCFDF